MLDHLHAIGAIVAAIVAAAGFGELPLILALLSQARNPSC
jgi:hypothetical protein